MTDHSVTNWTRADDAMVEGAIRRGASRRELLRMFMAGGVSLAVGGSILGRASAALAATPVMGGHLKAAGFTASTADTLDPAKASNATDYMRICAYYNRLTFLNENSEVQMELAESVETTDAKVWTVKLKSGVEFHDGKTPLRRGRGLLAPPPPGRGGRLEGELDRQAVRRHQGGRPADRRDHARSGRTPTCRRSSPCTIS